MKTAKRGITYVAGQSLGSLLILIMYAVLAHMLSVGNWGVYSIIIAFYTFLGLLGNFAIGAALRQQFARRRSAAAKKRLVASAYVASLTVSLVAALAGVLASRYIAVTLYHSVSLAQLLVVASVLAVCWAIFNLTLSVLVVFGRVAKAALTAIVYAGVQLAVSPLLVAMGYGLGGTVAGLAAGIVAAMLLGIAYVSKELGGIRLVPGRGDLAAIFKFASPVYMSQLAAQGIYNFSILLLGSVAVAATVGNFAIGYRLGSFVSIMLTTSVFVLVPAFSFEAAAGRLKRMGKALNMSIYYALLFIAPAVAYVASVAKPLVYLIFSHKYAIAPAYLSVVAVGLGISMVSSYASAMLFGMGDLWRFIKYQITAILVELTLLLALAPLFKASGVLVALFVISPILIDGIYIKGLVASGVYKPAVRKPLMVVLAAFIVFMLMYAVSHELAVSYGAIASNLLILLVAYPPVLAVVGGVSDAEVAFLKRVFGELRGAWPMRLILAYASVFVKRRD